MTGVSSLAEVGMVVWLTAAATVVCAVASAYNTIDAFPPARVNEVEGSGEEPNFGGVIENVTVAVGREAVLTCLVDNLGQYKYKVGWMRTDTQTILSLHKKVVTHNMRISVTHNEPRKWNLHIRSVKIEDRGCYMCQINTAVMKKNVGCIDVHVPPNILDEKTSGDITVPDGDSVYLVCTAEGYPEPKILWRREDKEKIMLRAGRGNRSKVEEVEGRWLNLTRVRRKQMGAYNCIAQNAVPPAVMKRIIVNVSFEPTVQVPNQLVGTPLGSDLALTCRVEAFPKPITFWRKNNDIMILDGLKYKVNETSESYHTNMSLIIRHVQASDIGTYTCVARNSISQAEGQIRTYEIDPPATARPTQHPPAHTFSTALDHGAMSPGVNDNEVEEEYKHKVQDPSQAQLNKGKRKNSEQPRRTIERERSQEAYRPSVFSSATLPALPCLFLLLLPCLCRSSSFPLLLPFLWLTFCAVRGC